MCYKCQIITDSQWPLTGYDIFFSNINEKKMMNKIENFYYLFPLPFL